MATAVADDKAARLAATRAELAKQRLARRRAAEASTPQAARVLAARALHAEPKPGAPHNSSSSPSSSPSSSSSYLSSSREPPPPPPPTPPRPPGPPQHRAPPAITGGAAPTAEERLRARIKERALARQQSAPAGRAPRASPAGAGAGGGPGAEAQLPPRVAVLGATVNPVKAVVSERRDRVEASHTPGRAASLERERQVRHEAERSSTATERLNRKRADAREQRDAERTPPAAPPIARQLQRNASTDGRLQQRNLETQAPPSSPGVSPALAHARAVRQGTGGDDADAGGEAGAEAREEDAEAQRAAELEALKAKLRERRARKQARRALEREAQKCAAVYTKWVGETLLALETRWPSFASARVVLGEAAGCAGVKIPELNSLSKFRSALEQDGKMLLQYSLSFKEKARELLGKLAEADGSRDVIDDVDAAFDAHGEVQEAVENRMEAFADFTKKVAADWDAVKAFQKTCGTLNDMLIDTKDAFESVVGTAEGAAAATAKLWEDRSPELRDAFAECKRAARACTERGMPSVRARLAELECTADDGLHAVRMYGEARVDQVRAERDMKIEYSARALKLADWAKAAAKRFEDARLPNDRERLQKLLGELRVFKVGELRGRQRELEDIDALGGAIRRMLESQGREGFGGAPESHDVHARLAAARGAFLAHEDAATREHVRQARLDALVHAWLSRCLDAMEWVREKHEFLDSAHIADTTTKSGLRSAKALLAGFKVECEERAGDLDELSADLREIVEERHGRSKELAALHEQLCESIGDLDADIPRRQPVGEPSGGWPALEAASVLELLLEARLLDSIGALSAQLDKIRQHQLRPAASVERSRRA